MKRKIGFLILLMTSSVYVILAQDEIMSNSAKNRFSIALLNNFGNTRFLQEFGSINNLDRLNSGHTLQFKYRYQFSQKLYADAALGFGAHIESLQPPMYDFGGFDFWHYHTFMHSRIEFSAAYQVYQFRKTRLNAKLGLGWNRFAAVGLGTSFSSGGDRLDATYDVEGKRLPFFTLGIEYTIPTKRKDEFSIYLGYQHAFNNSFYQGFYHYSNGNEVAGFGRFSSNLHAFQLGIGYTFTRQKRREKIAEMIQTNDVDLKEAKKKSRFERRIIDPQSRYLSFGIGIGVNRTKFSPNKDPFVGPGEPSFQHRLSYEHGWKNKLFFEADYYGFMFWQSQYVKKNNFNSGSAGDSFYGHFLTVGMNYKIQNPRTNLQLFNVHAGIGLGANFDELGPAASGGGAMTSDDYWYYYSYTSEVRGRLIPIVYTGISKDIRITERLLLNLAYRHQFGFLNVYKSEFLYSDNYNPDPRKLNSRIDGTAFSLQLGLKYRIK